MEEYKLKEQLIDLYGYTTGIKTKTDNQCIFYFSDYQYGQIVIVAERNCILYYQAAKGKEYHLKAVLKGVTSRQGGRKITRNTLVIKKVC